MNRKEVVFEILPFEFKSSYGETHSQYAPINIALIKYWGKRNKELNLPVTPSLSITIPEYGTKVDISLSFYKYDVLTINEKRIDEDSDEYKRLINFLVLFRSQYQYFFDIRTTSNIPIAAGLASSSSFFAALVKALNSLFSWKLQKHELSILARIGSGSAARSLYNGFVLWEKGEDENGMDSYAKPLKYTWNELRIGLVICSSKPKKMSSREAMNITQTTSIYYRLWSDEVGTALLELYQALKHKDFINFGSVVENNALSMHALMLSSKPSICYLAPETIEVYQKVWQLRKNGVEVYFTQDAGANVKLLFQERDSNLIGNEFPKIKMINPFKHIDIEY